MEQLQIPQPLKQEVLILFTFVLMHLGNFLI